MVTDEQPELSEKFTQIEIPANLLDCVLELKADSLLVLVAFFQLVSQQDQKSEIALAFNLKAGLPGGFQPLDLRLENALIELHDRELLFSWIDPQNPQKTYLIAGTPEGIETYRKLRENPDFLEEFNLAKVLPDTDRPNLFKLYEDNFGALTPMIAETLKADMEIFPSDWIEDAMKEAVAYNARNWKYVQAILRNWQDKGRKRRNEEGKRDLEQFRKLYLDQKHQHTGG